jgi:TPR repeat protein
MKTAHTTLKAGQQAFQNGEYGKAISEFLPLARSGNATAQHYMGRMFHEGKGLPEDNAAAFHWVRRSAERGHGDGEALLGLLYARGQGAPRDDDEAARWFLRAAARGNPSGQCNLGLCYLRGTGVPRDHMKAYMWFDLAASHSTGHDQMCNCDLRDTFAARALTPDLVAAAKQMSRDWKPERRTLRQSLHLGS